MNNNNRGNNRRRGRGNRQQGGGQQLNRIDSRARGNAPQLLEKYRKLAHDAHLNGDRVQAEYYLQFADHYFRVIADTRLRQEEGRNRPQGERWQDGADEGEDAGEFAADSDFPSFDQPGYGRSGRQGQDERSRDERGREERSRDERPRDERGRQPRQDREDRFERQERDADMGPGNDDSVVEAEADERQDANPYEPAENPFVRENRGNRGLRPRRSARPVQDDDAPAGLDPSSLSPSIGVTRDEADEADGAEPAKPRRGRPRRKPAADESLETVG